MFLALNILFVQFCVSCELTNTLLLLLSAAFGLFLNQAQVNLISRHTSPTVVEMQQLVFGIYLFMSLIFTKIDTLLMFFFVTEMLYNVSFHKLRDCLITGT